MLDDLVDGKLPDHQHNEFVRKMNEVAEGTPQDIAEPTDDTTFERKSRDLVKLYR